MCMRLNSCVSTRWSVRRGVKGCIRVHAAIQTACSVRQCDLVLSTTLNYSVPSMTLNSIRPEQDVTKAPGTSVRSSSITTCSPELRSLQMFGFGNKPNLRRDLPGPVFLLLLVRFWDRGVKKVELAARPCGVLADVESVSRSRTIFSPKMGVRVHVTANSGKLGCITSVPPPFFVP